MYKILVIDDELNIRENIQEILELSGYDVELAQDGYQGIQTALVIKPDLIICDIMMPHLSGYEVLNAMQRGDVTNIPFIFLSAKTERSSVRTGMDMGADDYLTKPFIAAELLSAIKSRLEQKQKIKKEIELQVNKLNKQVLAMASHEFNTPLSGIIGASDFLLNHYSDLSRDEIAKFLEAVNISGKRMHKMTSNIMMYGWLEKFEETHQFDSDLQMPTRPLEAISERLTELASHYHRNSDLRIGLTSLEVVVAENYILKIIGELVDNAFKFSKASNLVSIYSSIEDEWVKISVSDTGNGCNMLKVDTIKAFTQFERDMQEQQGAGLGLYIVKKLVQFNRGKLHISSKSGSGTTIDIRFPRFHS